MTHPIDKILSRHNETLGSDYWLKFDELFMEFCSEIAVLMIDGWRQSSGVARELRFFKERRRPIHYLTHDGTTTRLAAGPDVGEKKQTP
jgi:hypothetical protein